MSSRASRGRRHQEILRLLGERPIASQGALAEALAAEGHPVSQSTLSRDLRDLRILRVPTADGYRYRPASTGPPPAMDRVAAGEVLRIAANENLVVVRTQVGRAPGVAALLDARPPEGLLATVAGDDTILVVPTRGAETAALARRLRDLLRPT